MSCDEPEKQTTFAKLHTTSCDYMAIARAFGNNEYLNVSTKICSTFLTMYRICLICTVFTSDYSYIDVLPKKIHHLKIKMIFATFWHLVLLSVSTTEDGLQEMVVNFIRYSYLI